jgi:integrase
VTKPLLPYVQRFRDRQGRLRHYFRRGLRRVPLPGVPGGEEFMAVYSAEIAATAPPPQIGASRTKAGTVAALVATYYGSGAFLELSARTQSERRRVVEHFRERHGDKRVALMARDNIVRGLDQIAKPHAKRNWLKAMRGLMTYAVDIGMIAADPTAGVKVKVKDRGGFHTWTDEEIAQYRAHHALGTRARLAFELLLETVQRRSDVVRMGPQHVRDGWLKGLNQQKTGVPIAVPVSVELQAAIDATPCQHLTFLTTMYGKPFTAEGFGGYFRECCDAAGLPKHCAAHGLRKAGSRRYAEVSATDREIMAITGHKTPAEVTRYTRDADRERLAAAAMAKRRKAEA